MSAHAAAPVTLGQRLDREARVLLARRSEAPRQIGPRGHPVRAGDPPGNRRLRVEADVPPAWVDDPPGAGGFDGAPGPVHSPGLPFPADLRERLRPALGPGLERVVLHDGEVDPAADALAR